MFAAERLRLRAVAGHDGFEDCDVFAQNRLRHLYILSAPHP
jgi:hypothetical protein